MKILSELKDFIFNFPFYLKQGFSVIGIKINNSIFNFYIWSQKMEAKGREMQEIGRKKLKEIEENKKNI